MQVLGPFDGDLTNTQAAIGGQPIPILAESPRQVVLMSPSTPTGPVAVQIREGARAFEGVTHNIGVTLSAPRTTLARGERTTVTLRVVGLQNVQTPVAIALWASPTVSLQGGDQQTITIPSGAANNAGEFSRSFDLSVVAAGPFDVTARLGEEPSSR